MVPTGDRKPRRPQPATRMCTTSVHAAGSGQELKHPEIRVVVAQPRRQGLAVNYVAAQPCERPGRGLDRGLRRLGGAPTRTATRSAPTSAADPGQRLQLARHLGRISPGQREREPSSLLVPRASPSRRAPFADGDFFEGVKEAEEFAPSVTRRTPDHRYARRTGGLHLHEQGGGMRRHGGARMAGLALANLARRSWVVGPRALTTAAPVTPKVRRSRPHRLRRAATSSTPRTAPPSSRPTTTGTSQLSVPMGWTGSVAGCQPHADPPPGSPMRRSTSSEAWSACPG